MNDNEFLVATRWVDPYVRTDGDSNDIRNDLNDNNSNSNSNSNSSSSSSSSKIGARSGITISRSNNSMNKNSRNNITRNNSSNYNNDRINSEIRDYSEIRDNNSNSNSNGDISSRSDEVVNTKEKKLTHSDQNTKGKVVSSKINKNTRK